ncbi:FadR/GntR family transcriptional regulator [Paracoccus actinidiae]|uniref:FadR/GntR family transcriptional regulator n=1 Tax=Paracoccus actinidiae TaxID=3064531 RepID=UPI0027D31817|nr:FCD domain-containing protein [Paracoccus sp. M09]
MALQYDEIVRGGLARQVSDLIRMAILEGRLALDERLPTEEELARRFGISRPTVREALKVLAAQNLIRSRRGPTGGTFVNRPGAAGAARAITDAATLLVGMGHFNIDEIVTARVETEALCCRLAALNRGDGDLAALASEIALQQDQALSDEDFCGSDVRFHRAVVQATGNGPLQMMMHAMIESFIPITNMLIYRDHERRRTVAAHEKIRAAIGARDADKAEQLMRGHVRGMRVVLDQALARRNA